MNTFASILTTITVLIHSVLGCCVHHSHGCEMVHEHSVAVESAAEHDEHSHTCGHESPSHDDHDPQHDGDQSGDHEGHGQCDEDACSFVTTSRVDFQSSLSAVWLIPTTDCLSAADASKGSRDGFPTESPPRYVSKPLYALSQAWLV
jgi:hypothetical protein